MARQGGPGAQHILTRPHGLTHPNRRSAALVSGLLLALLLAGLPPTSLAHGPQAEATTTAEGAGVTSTPRSGVADDVPATAASPPATSVRVTHAPTPTQVYGPGGSDDLEFVCPEPPNGLPIDPRSVAFQDPVTYGCPFRVYDTRYSLGNAAIALPHHDHAQVVFTSLHAGASEGDPYDHSRAGGGVHTTFTSTNQGLRWADQPTPPQNEPTGDVRGSDNDVVLDSEGNMYLTYLYHVAARDDGWRPLIGLYKGGPPGDSDIYAAYERAQFFGPRDPLNEIKRVHLLQLPAAVPPSDEDLAANETAQAADDDALGDTAATGDLANATKERIVAIWHEANPDPVNGTTGLSGHIDVAWTDVGGRNDWVRLPADQVIGPCSAGSNGIQWDGRIYVACVVDRGYADRPRARIGDVDLWEIDLSDNTTRLVTTTGLATRGDVLLAQSVTEDNTYVGALVWDHVETDNGTLVRLEVQTGYAWLSTLTGPYGRLEANNLDLGIQLRQWGEGSDDIPLLDAHITAFEMTDDTFQSLLVYNEWHDDPQDLPDYDEEADPQTIVQNRLTDYNKFFMAFNGCDGAVAGYRAELGSAIDQYNAGEYLNHPGVFNEPRDGLYKTRETGTGEELLYFAIGDYGAIQYGAVLVNRMSSLCTPPPPPPFIPAAVAPQALTTASGVSNLVAAGFAIPAAAMVGYMLTVKRRRPLYSAAEDGP